MSRRFIFIQGTPMRVTIASKQIAVAGAVLVSIIGVNATAFAQSTAATGICPSWIDAKTGAHAKTVPIGVDREELTRLQVSHDNHANGASGRTWVRQSDGAWIDAKTGATAETVPIGVDREELTRLQVSHDNHANGASGRTWVLIPCPPPNQPASVQALPVLPFGFSFGVGRRDHGDDPYRK